MTDCSPAPGTFRGPLHDLALAESTSPDRRLLAWRDGELSVARFAAAVRSVALELRDHGVLAGSRVAVMAANSHRLLVATYAIWTLGAVEVSVNSELKGPLLKHVLDDSDPALLLADDLFIPVVRSVRPDLGTLRLDDLRHDRDTSETFRLAGDDALASLLYTSGTTGPSKGVMIPHGYYSYFASVLGTVLNLGESDTCYFTLPFFHVDAHIALPACLRWGSSLAFASRFSVSSFWEDVMHFDASWFGAVGSMLSALVSRGRPPQRVLDRLRLIVAAPVPQEAFANFEDAWGVPILQMYGQTEANGPLYSTLARRRRGAAGWPCAGFDVKVVDDSGAPAPRGRTGELLIRPSSANALAQGYWRRADATAAAFVDGWYRTGDLVRQDEDGFVWYVGRKKDSLRRRGENISAFELESVLSAAPGVRIAAALAVRDELGGEDDIKAVLAVAPQFDLAVFGDYCRSSLPRFAVPRFVEIVDESRIVRGPGTGAIQKHLLPQGVTEATIDLEVTLAIRQKGNR